MVIWPQISCLSFSFFSHIDLALQKSEGGIMCSNSDGTRLCANHTRHGLLEALQVSFRSYSQVMLKLKENFTFVGVRYRVCISDDGWEPSAINLKEFKCRVQDIHYAEGRGQADVTTTSKVRLLGYNGRLE